MYRTGWLALLLLAPGCGTSTEPTGDGWPWHSLSVTGKVGFEGHSTLIGDTVQVRLVFQNLESAAAQVEFGVCAFLIEGVGDHGAKWDNRPDPGIGCADLALVLDLAPGERRSIPVYRGEVARLRSKVPSGYYRISIGFREAGALKLVSGGGITL